MAPKLEDAGKIDIETSSSAAAAAARKPAPGFVARLATNKRLAWALVAVAVACTVTAVVVGVVLGTRSSGGSSGSSSSSTDSYAAPSPPPLPPPPSPDANTSAASPPPAVSPSPEPSPTPSPSPLPPSPSPSPSPPPASPPPSPPASSPPPPPSSPAVPDIPAGWTLLWNDEFDGAALDTSKWSYDLGTGDWGWGNGELQSYTASPANVRVEGGSLLITAVKGADGSYTSGRINTRASASFVPGMQRGGQVFSTLRVEGRLRVPAPPAQGLWSAFWMFPVDLKYGPWPASGEIDISEAINAMTEITQCIHYGGNGPGEWVQWPVPTPQPNGQPWSNDYHIFAVEWSADTLSFSIDGRSTFVAHSAASQPAGSQGWYTRAAGAGPNAPYDQPFFIILNLAVGGQFPKDPDASTQFPAVLAVDYVRVYGQ